MELEIVVALVGAAVSIGLALLANYFTKANEKNLELLKARLDEQKGEKDAKRDYVYDARKRVYTECEPLFFLMNEFSQNALSRIFSLANASRNGELRNWLDHEGYYLRSTVYYLLAPLSIYKLVQRRLTSIDLSVEPNVKIRYELIKSVARTFTDDFVFAGFEPKLEYEPNPAFPSVSQPERPEKYYRQGIPSGVLDNALESLIVENLGNPPRIMSFGEFENNFQKEGSTFRTRLLSIKDLFLNFDPEKRPVLWRILVTQAHLYFALSRACETKANCLDITEVISDLDRKQFDYRHFGDETNYEKVLEDPFRVAELWLMRYFQINAAERLSPVLLTSKIINERASQSSKGAR